MKRYASVGATGSFVLVSLFACTGEDPDPVVASPDGGSSSTSSSGSTSGSTSSTSGSVREAGAPTCAGQPFTSQFEIAAPVSPYAAGEAPGWRAEMHRMLGTKMFFGGTKKVESGLGLYVADSTGGDHPTLANATSLQAANLDDAEAETWPTPSRSVSGTDGEFLFYTHENGGKGNLYYAKKTGSAVPLYTVGTFLSELATGDLSDTTPWLAGSPSKALYWARAVTPQPFRIVRSDVKLPPGDLPTVQPPAELDVPCPGGAATSCAVPAVTPDERIMLFATFPFPTPSPFTYTAYEAILGADRKAVGEPIKHEEVGSRYPSWISDDGCRAIFGSTASSVFATRTPK